MLLIALGPQRAANSESHDRLDAHDYQRIGVFHQERRQMPSDSIGAEMAPLAQPVKCSQQRGSPQERACKRAHVVNPGIVVAAR